MPFFYHSQAIFLAHGPAFKENFTASPFENIELYNLMSGKLNNAFQCLRILFSVSIEAQYKTTMKSFYVKIYFWCTFRHVQVQMISC